MGRYADNRRNEKIDLSIRLRTACVLAYTAHILAIGGLGCFGYAAVEKIRGEQHYKKNEEINNCIFATGLLACLGTVVSFGVGAALAISESKRETKGKKQLTDRQIYILRRECPECEGRGKIDCYDHSYGSGGWEDCSSCKGTGKIQDENLPKYDRELHGGDSV